MRVGILTTSYPRFPGDPAGHFVQGHALALAGPGRALEVLAADDPGPPPGAAHGAFPVETVRRGLAHERAAAAGDALPRLRVIRVAAARGLFYAGGAPEALALGGARAAWAAAAFSARLAAAVAVRAPGWDAIIAHWLAPSALAALPAAAPLLAIAHGGDVFTLRHRGLLAPALHALRLRRARLAFVSAELLAVARAAAPRSPTLQRYLDAAIVQPMGIDVHALDDRPRVRTERPTIAVVGRLAPIKGVDVALAALAEVRAPVHLIVVGAGPEWTRLHALAQACPARHRVSFMGAASTAAVGALLCQTSVVVVPSRALPDGRTEGTPLIALEALAAGVPVVATATGGLRALAPAADLVPPDAPGALAAAIDRALAAPPAPERLRAAVTHLDWSQVARVLAPTQGSA